MLRLMLVVFFVGAAFAQPAFQGADVHVSAPATNPDLFVSGGFLRGERYDLRKATMLDLIRIAWSVDADKVVGGPSWLELDRFDIAAKALAGTSPETVNLMLQGLLSARFGLVVHKDMRPMPAFALVKGKGKGPLKMNASDGTVTAGCRQGQPLKCRNITMDAFAVALRRFAGDYLTAPVVNSTGMDGTWDFDLKWDARRSQPAAGERATIFDAVDRQLGLTLELQQMPVPVMVVDRVNEKPSANAPEVERMLPPAVPEFEVAAIKMSAPDERFGYRRSPGGRIELHAFPMQMLIATAWDVDWDHMDERISGPKWMESKRFDIVANTPAAPDGPRGAGFMDEDIRLMLRALLKDRFQIATHFEEKPVSAYTLAAVKPKLKKADPANRSGCREAGVVASDPRDANPRLSRLIQCRNLTMAQFAQQLQTLDRVEATFNEVVDETGLKGAYDFELSFTPKSLVQSEGDPNGAITFFEAIRQLGLKLEMTKRPMPVLVVDRVAEQPTGN